MGRSSAKQASQNRARIVEIAAGLFRAHGVEAVSVADIMATAGMTVGGFYKHFASKEALAVEAVALAFDQASTLWGGMLDKDNEPSDEGLARLAAHYLRPNPQGRCPMLAFAPLAARKGGNAPIRDTYDKGTSALLDAFTGGHRPDGPAADVTDADRQVLLLFAAMVGARILGEAAGEVAWIGDIRKAVIDAVAEQEAGGNAR